MGSYPIIFFSPTYRTLFDELKKAVTLNSPEERFNQVKAVLGITYDTAKKKINSQFQELKEKAEEALCEEIPVYRQSS